MTCDYSKPNLVLDLDETLVHTEVLSEFINIKSDNSEILTKFDIFEKKYIVFARPHLMEFLNEVYKNFNLYIYTFGTKVYADKVIGAIIKKIQYNLFKNIYTREDFKFGRKILREDICERDTVIIDDNIHVWQPNQVNLIQIDPFYGPIISNINNDNELKKILQRLEKIIVIYGEMNYVDLNFDISELAKQTQIICVDSSIITDIDTDDEDIIVYLDNDDSHTSNDCELIKI